MQQQAATDLLDTADRLRQNALGLAEEDAAAFTAVTEAYGLPKGTPDEAAARSAAIAKALVGAAHVPAIVIAVAEQVVSLAEQVLPIGNRNVISDVAAAAEAARAAATTARVNVEVNLGGIKDPATRGELAAVADTVDDLVLRAEKVTTAVRDGLVR